VLRLCGTAVVQLKISQQQHGSTASQQHLINFFSKIVWLEPFRWRVIQVELNEIRTGGSLSEECGEVLRCSSCAVENYLTATRQHSSTATRHHMM